MSLENYLYPLFPLSFFLHSSKLTASFHLPLFHLGPRDSSDSRPRRFQSCLIEVSTRSHLPLPIFPSNLLPFPTFPSLTLAKRSSRERERERERKMVDVYISIGQGESSAASKEIPGRFRRKFVERGTLRTPLPSILSSSVSFFLLPFPSFSLSFQKFIYYNVVDASLNQAWRKTKERKGVKFDRGVLLYFWKRLFQSMNILKANKAEHGSSRNLSLSLSLSLSPYQRTQRSSRLLNRPANAFLSTLS